MCLHYSCGGIITMIVNNCHMIIIDDTYLQSNHLLLQSFISDSCSSRKFAGSMVALVALTECVPRIQDVPRWA